MNTTPTPATEQSPNLQTSASAPWKAIPSLVEEIEDLRATFSDTSLSVAHVLCDRHPRADVAFTIVDADLQASTLTFGDLADRSRRLATALDARGISRGTRVGVLMSKSAALPTLLLALWRLGAVTVPLFTAFAGPAIATRVNGARAHLIVSDPDQVAKLDGIDIPILASDTLDALIDDSEPWQDDVAVGPDDLIAQLYTSGTTGAPKAVGIPAFAIAAFTAYMRYGFDVRKSDIFWNAADPGWAYGLYYGLIGPLAIGRPNILLAGGFSTAATARVMEEHGVTNFAASPTVYRALRRDGVVLSSRLRVASSAGEPLTPEVNAWAPEALGSLVRDHWGQTEHGMAIINSWDERLREDIREGSMGQAMPGFAAGLVDGAIALSVDESPLMWYPGYVENEQKTRERFTPDGRWYLSGDVGAAEDDRFRFASRDDDVILAAGYRIPPFDIESIIVRDAAIAEAAVVGRHDEVKGEAVVAFVTLVPGADTDGLQERLQTAVRNGYGAHARPREVHFVEALPKTPSGKVQRFILRGLSDDEVTRMTVG